MFPNISKNIPMETISLSTLELLLNPLRPATGGIVTQIFVAAVFFANLHSEFIEKIHDFLNELGMEKRMAEVHIY